VRARRVNAHSASDIQEQVVASRLANPTARPTVAADAHTAELFVHEPLQLWRLELGHGGACASRAGALKQHHRRAAPPLKTPPLPRTRKLRSNCGLEYASFACELVLARSARASDQRPLTTALQALQGALSNPRQAPPPSLDPPELSKSCLSPRTARLLAGQRLGTPSGRPLAGHTGFNLPQQAQQAAPMP